MRVLPVVLLLMLVGTGMSATAKKPKTEAEQDGLIGPVHSVVMIKQKVMFKLPTSTAWLLPYIHFGDVEYDTRGYRTKMGAMDEEGEFLGMAYQFKYDSSGHVIEKTTILLPSPEIVQHDVYGPFGLVESTSISSGKPGSARRMSYDQQGNVLEDLILDNEGKPLQRTQYRRNSDGAWTERTVWVKGVLHSHESYDPDTDFQRYEQYDSSGNVVVTFTFSHGRVDSYWSASTDPDGGTPLIDRLANGDTKQWLCYNVKRTCEGFTRHGTYLDAGTHDPMMTEILSDDGKPEARAYYEYVFDEHKNWTSRKVWIQSGEQGERTLYETDTRTITYWSR